MKRTLGVAGALLLALLACKPVVAGVIVDGSVVTDYMWRGFNTLNGNPAFQPSVTWVNAAPGVDLNAWFSWGLTQRGQRMIRDFDEVDLTGSYTRNVGPLLVRGGIFHLSWYGRDHWPDDRSTVVEVFAGVGTEEVWGSPTVTVNYDVNAADGHDLYIEGRIGHEFAFSRSAALFGGLSMGYFDTEWIGAKGISDINLELSTTLLSGSYALTPRFVFTYVPLSEVNPDKLTFWAGLSVSKAWIGFNE